MMTVRVWRVHRHARVNEALSCESLRHDSKKTLTALSAAARMLCSITILRLDVMFVSKESDLCTEISEMLHCKPLRVKIIDCTHQCRWGEVHQFCKVRTRDTWGVRLKHTLIEDECAQDKGESLNFSTRDS